MEETSRRGILGWDQSCCEEGLKFYQTRSNAMILHETLPAYCIPKVVRIKIQEIIYEKVYMSLRPPPKISLRHEWTKESGWKVVQQPEGEVVRQTKFFQSTQPIPNPIRDRSGRLGFGVRLEEFKQFDDAHILHHFLWFWTKSVTCLILS